jgi:hypothetical protein
LSGLFLSGFPTKILYISHLPHAYYIPHPSHPPWFDHPNNIWQRVHTTELLMMLFCVFLAPCKLISRCQCFREAYCLNLQPWRWIQYVFLKRHLSMSLHGAKT